MFIFITIFFEANSIINIRLVQLAEKGVTALNILGILLIISAIAMPVIVKNYYDSRIEGYENISDLGGIGDFIGGTTVAFLTAASVVLLLATIIMQRKEIKISQLSIKELVKQTEATVRQAEEAREETKISNVTMKKQQFETTFFNMINLHHRILGEIKINDSHGREAIKYFYGSVKKNYETKVKIIYSNSLKEEALAGDIEILNDLVKQIYLALELDWFKKEFENEYYHEFYNYGEEDSYELSENFYKSIKESTNNKWNEKKKNLLLHYEVNIKGNITEYKKILSRNALDFYEFKDVDNHYLLKFNEEYNKNPLKELRREAYESSYKEKENQIGHYYRNLYRIVKLIQSEDFGLDEKNTDFEKSKYRGILRAQLSSYELLMVFYNVAYSEKGEKFKELLKDTNFFDNHLIKDDFIWKNDSQELLNLNIKNS